ncbi:MAG: aminotransferase class I/II-fold pyridoxal phosphate-dependent enzyme, partial [Flavobacteriales bacterium]
MRLSPVVSSMSESATLLMAQRCREMRAAGKDVVDLSLGEPDQDPPAFAIEAAQKAISDNKWNKYPPVMGYPDVRAAISEKFKRDNGLEYAPDQVMVSTGAKQSIMNVVVSLVGPGDEVVIPAPFWVSYAEQVRFTGATPVLVPSTLEEDYKPPIERIAAAITPRTRLLMFSSPCNPSGSVLTMAEL